MWTSGVSPLWHRQDLKEGRCRYQCGRFEFYPSACLSSENELMLVKVFGNFSLKIGFLRKK